MLTEAPVIVAPAGIPAISTDVVMVPKPDMLEGIVTEPELMVVGPTIPPVLLRS